MYGLNQNPKQAFIPEKLLFKRSSMAYILTRLFSRKGAQEGGKIEEVQRKEGETQQ